MGVGEGGSGAELCAYGCEFLDGFSFCSLFFLLEVECGRFLSG